MWDPQWSSKYYTLSLSTTYKAAVSVTVVTYALTGFTIYLHLSNVMRELAGN